MQGTAYFIYNAGVGMNSGRGYRVMQDRNYSKVMAGYFALLFLALFFMYRPTFSNPPRSDYWCLFYHFHAYQDLSGFERVVTIANYDVWGHGTYRPLFHLVLYGLHLLFGARYLWFHTVTFGFYCFSIILMYRLARVFGCGRAIAAAFLTVFAFLFSHFDIVAWTFHLAVIVGFSLFLMGFLSYLEYRRSGRLLCLGVAVLCFLPGLLCYETFLFWPPAIFFLLPGGGSTDEFRSRSKGPVLPSILALVVLYAVYGSVVLYLHSRSPLGAPSASARYLFSVPAIYFSFAVTAFSIVFNGVIANIIPVLTCPVIVQDNIGRGGLYLLSSPVLRQALADRSAGALVAPPLIVSKAADLDSLWRPAVAEIDRFLSISGGILICLFIIGLVLLLKKRPREFLSPFFFYIFLLVTGVFVLIHGRMGTNFPIYVLRQFRYQYLSNALVMLVALFVVDRLLKFHPRLRWVIYPFLSIVLAVNVIVLLPHIAFLREQMAPLDGMLSAVRMGIREGEITPARKIYLDDAIAPGLPPLCWNHDMARFMNGTYQWIFRDANGRLFAFSRGEAGWEIDPESLKLKQVR